MKTKTSKELQDMEILEVVNPMLFAAIATANFLAGWMFSKEVTVTSVERTKNDPFGLHQAYRAVDLRIYFQERDGLTEELTEGEWIQLADKLNGTFRYGRTNHGRPTQCFKVRLARLGHHEDPANDHVHVQTPRKGAWV